MAVIPSTEFSHLQNHVVIRVIWVISQPELKNADVPLVISWKSMYIIESLANHCQITSDFKLWQITGNSLAIHWQFTGNSLAIHWQITGKSLVGACQITGNSLNTQSLNHSSDWVIPVSKTMTIHSFTCKSLVIPIFRTLANHSITGNSLANH